MFENTWSNVSWDRNGSSEQLEPCEDCCDITEINKHTMQVNRPNMSFHKTYRFSFGCIIQKGH